MTGVDDLRFLEPPGGPTDQVVWCRGPVERHSSAIVLLHDRAANLRCWDLVMRRLPSGVAVIAVDLRGRGSAWRSDPSRGMISHIADLVSLLDRLDIDEVLAVGHGLGAILSSELVIRSPDRVPLAVGVVGTDLDDPFDAVLGLAFPDRAEHIGFWQQQVRFRHADPEALRNFVGHGVAGPADHHRWRVDLRSMIADDHSVASASPSALTRTVVVGATPDAAATDVAAVQPTVLQPTVPGPTWTGVHLPDHDPASVLLTSAGADAIAAQIRLLLA